MVDLPDGGQRPFCDPIDVFVMMSNSPVLTFTLILNISTHLTSDIAHIIILKHISALARTLCDALKLFLMWLLGKVFWFFAILPVLAEVWHPGYFGSVLMIPAMCATIYGMLMFKNGVFLPITYVKGEGFKEVKMEVSKEQEEEEEVAANLDDPFFMDAFRSRKLKKHSKRAWGKLKAHNRLGRLSQTA